MPLTSGTRLGPYEILSPIGAGGMGEVYRARDTRLGREVAIKALPEVFARDPERLARFEREAKVLASLGHANIAAIHGLEDAGGVPALVMELVEGPTLAERIARGALPADEALAVARQLAEALEYAHERGIVHRDLKPANLKLRPDGTVKVLDFGLARALDPESANAGSDLTQSPTLTQRMTTPGVILGTAAYMSPEQARGREADRRADVWAFGVVVFEMLTGSRAFAGETISDTLASVMRDEPDWSLLPETLSPRWRLLLQRCLTKDPRARLQAIGEARIALEDLAAHPKDEPPASAGAPAGRRAATWAPWGVAALAGVAAVATLALQLRPPARPTASEVSVVPAGGRRLGADIAYHFMAIAPDGRSLAYTVRDGGRLLLRLRKLDTREDVEIPGAEGARNLFFSPGGDWIGFFDSRAMYKVSVRGGTPVKLADAGQDRLGAWLDDGTIVFSPETTVPLYRIPESGGTPVAITRLDSTKMERTHRFPCALAGGPWVVFTVGTVGSPGGYDGATIDAVSVRTGERRTLVRGARRAVWAPPGYLVFDRAGDLYAVPIDPRDPRVTREPVPVLDRVAGETSSGASFFDFAGDGTLAWVPASEREGVRQIGWFDRAGRWTPTAIPAGEYRRLTLSPDGRRALVEVGPGGGAEDLWLADLGTSGMSRLTYGHQGGSAVWLREGARIAHAQRDSLGGDQVIVRRLDGAGGIRRLYRSGHPLIPTDVTPDGEWVVFSDYGLSDGRIHLARAGGDAAVRDLPAEGGYEQAGTISPDGRWLAYITNKTRREEVCVRRLDGTGGSWQVTINGGGGVRWGRDGRELFLVAGENLMRVPVEPRGDGLEIGQAEVLFEVPASPTEPTFRDYAYDPNTDRFLFTRPLAGAGDRREIALSLGWTSRLKERLNAKRGESR